MYSEIYGKEMRAIFMKITRSIFFILLLTGIILALQGSNGIYVVDAKSESKEEYFIIQGDTVIIKQMSFFRKENYDPEIIKNVIHIVIDTEETNLIFHEFDKFLNAVSIQIPKDVESISINITNIPKLERILVDEDNSFYSSVDGILYNKEKTKLIAYPLGKNKDVVIPEGTRIIGNRAFNNAGITSVVFPEGLVKIDSNAFSENLITEINLPASFCYLHEQAFLNTPLEKVQVAEENQYLCSIDGVVYNKDKSLLFYYPEEKKAKRLEFPESLTYLDCSKIKQFDKSEVLVIPNALKNISATANNQLQKIEISETQPYMKMYDGVLYNKDYKRILVYPNMNADTEITLHDNLYSISMKMFGTENTTKVLTIPKSLKKLTDERTYNSVLLSGFSNLEEIKLSADNPYFKLINGVLYNNDVTKMLWFPIALNVTEFQIPETVTLVDNDQLIMQKNLTKLFVPKNCMLYDIWSFGGEYTIYYEEPIGKECPKLKAFVVDEQNPYYSSSDGVLFDKKATKLIMYPACKTEKTYRIPSNVIEATFPNENHYLKELVIPENLNIFDLQRVFESYTYYGNSLLRYDALEKITVASGNERYFSVDGVLYENSSLGVQLIIYPRGKKSKELNLPSNVKLDFRREYFLNHPYLKKILLDEKKNPDKIVDGKLKINGKYVDFGPIKWEYSKES